MKKTSQELLESPVIEPSNKQDKLITLNIKKYFLLTTDKIILLGLFVSLYVIFGIFSKFMPFLWPGSTFLKLEFTYFIFLMIARFYNIFYTTITIIICSFLRWPDSSFPVGNLALIISGISLVYSFYFFNLIFKKIKWNSQIKLLLILSLTSISTSIIMCIINKIFLISFYMNYFHIHDSIFTSNKFIWGIIFPFNLVNTLINCSLFFYSYYVIIFFAKKNDNKKNNL